MSCPSVCAEKKKQGGDGQRDGGCLDMSCMSYMSYMTHMTYPY